jgi:homocysteine S-methyltransferase
LTTRAKYRGRLPQLDGRPFLTDGGLETTLVFHEDWDLPNFEAFTLLDSDRGRDALRAYFNRYVPMALAAGAGFVLESPTWRATPDWGAKVGYDRDALVGNNQAAIAFLLTIRDRYETPSSPMVVSGAIGPRGDGYDPGTIMSREEAAAYHAFQISIFRDAGADLVTAFTMTNTNEATGIAQAAKAAGMPCVISFTVETDGRLPTGQNLGDAVATVDAATAKGPAYYIINCAHPTHFDHVLDARSSWVKRVRGLRANSSRCSHAELDESPVLDAGDPIQLGKEYAAILRRLPHINVLGGCCGTDHRHVACISEALPRAAA